MTAFRKYGQIDISYGSDSEGNITHTKIILKVNGVTQSVFCGEVFIVPSALFADLKAGIVSAVGTALF